MSPITKALAAIAIMVGSVLAGAAQAASQTTAYSITLTIDRIEQYSACNNALSGYYTFGCLSVGDTFTGGFSVDSAILATDGLNNTASIFDFFLPFGRSQYATGTENVTLAGFRNGSGFASAPGFLIQGGQVVDLVGGVYGSADIPFIDMHNSISVPRNSFLAYDGRTAAYGSLTVAAAVPEPETYAMMALGLGAVGWAARRRKAARQIAPAA
ncbi:PEP-CTERM sorting domain-containing protein [Methylibium rhizosphaerae]|uniref:PEP-CTERM sorting domain-containing protein n=1 Tax=Methylibium rhizosphaerae TaxID=2570323 RepID=UPI001FE41E8E|nr:PEP-CTERM sorting domain-containing protein [Methylibium rhizosphaerae]